MRALIMAGGAGSRLAMGEKPLISVCGRPMIAYILDAFLGAGTEPVVVASSKTAMTANWCRVHGFPVVITRGDGYIEDMVSAVRFLEESSPVIVSVSDIPCITPAIISSILQSYNNSGMDALSTWVPASLVKSTRGSMPYRDFISGTDACPAGINILRGDGIEAEQEEFTLLLDEPRLALNINTREDLARAESVINLFFTRLNPS
jgi:adenosylcobinamide-phosphate guanylyltransferase